MTWHSRLQNHAFRHRPQSRSLPALLPQAWHDVAADTSEAGITPGAVVLGPAAAGKRSVTSVAGVGALSAGQQLAPEWPCLAATTWHTRLQNHAFRQRPQRSSLHPLLPQAWHDVAAGAIIRCVVA